MTVSNLRRHPRLRSVELQPVSHQGQTFLLLRDPLNLSEKTVLVPKQLIPVIQLCDGTFNKGDMAGVLASEFGLHIDPDEIENLISVLDEAFLLENERTSAARELAIKEFRQAPFRLPILAENSYPSRPDELRELLDSYIDSIGPIRPSASPVRGLVSPHIDYSRGARVYAEVWKMAAEAAREAELVIILGTNHYGLDKDLTLTRQSYATPFGVLPTSDEAVASLSETLGEDQAFKGELYHRGEHSIELAAVWLHYIRDGRSCDILPILTGSFAPFIQQENQVKDDVTITGAVGALRTIAEKQRTLVIAAADLAHVGPAFGGSPLDLQGHAKLHASDRELIEQICSGDANAFLDPIIRIEDQNNVCGVAPIYFTLQILSPVHGEEVAYEHCPADQVNSSAVSVCGILFH